MYDDDDDRPIGRVLSRRGAMTLLGAGSVASLLRVNTDAVGAVPVLPAQAAAQTPGCVAKPEMTERP